jgi:hypothetical protein
VELLEEPELLEPPVDAVVRELGALALCDAAEFPPFVVRAPVLLVPDRPDVELVPDRLVVLERFKTPEEVAPSDEPLLLEAAVNSVFPEDAEDPEPAPEEEPAVFDATATGVPVLEA